MIRIHLTPGEMKKVTFHLPVDQLAFIDNNLDLVLESGRIFVMVGSSFEDIRERSDFRIVEDNTLPLNERVFVCPVTVE